MACLFLRSNGIYSIVLTDINGRRAWFSTGSRDRAEAEIIMNDRTGVLSITIRILYLVVWRGKSRLSALINYLTIEKLGI
jgi:hypothetical protein